MQFFKITVLSVALNALHGLSVIGAEWEADDQRYFHESTSWGTDEAFAQLSPHVLWEEIGLKVDSSSALRIELVPIDEYNFQWVYSKPVSRPWFWYNPISWYNYYMSVSPTVQKMIAFHMSTIDAGLSKLTGVEFLVCAEDVATLLAQTTLTNRQIISRMLPRADEGYFYTLRRLLKATTSQNTPDHSEV